MARCRGTTEKTPGLFEVMASAINIMQGRITKRRMAGDPRDVLISPRLAKLGLLEFDRAE
jgi:NTE family protein